MSRVRIHAIGISVDGFTAGPRQSLENPLGERGPELFQWFFPTRTFCRMHGGGEGTMGPDNDFAARGFDNVGAWILGRNMFGPVRGPWPDESWKGWWGDEPPYHVPTFVLTHYARAPLEMRGGTTFHFVTGGIEEALRRAKDAAGPKDVRIGGGAATIRQYLAAGVVDEIHLAQGPVLLGSGERLFDASFDLRAQGFRVTERVMTENAVHVVMVRK